MPPSRPVIVTPKNGATKQFTQSELFQCLQGSCGFHTKAEAKAYYEGFTSMIQTALKKGYKLMLPGLGKIQVRTSKARMGRNPMTGEEIRIPARRKVRFTPLKALKDAVL
ncbi:MAG: HU family DNA-binding protein [Deltaproteobacteria bacterium]|nr:HU family DNA-binding protein [Deltaproteobacteria bacterium]